MYNLYKCVYFVIFYCWFVLIFVDLGFGVVMGNYSEIEWYLEIVLEKVLSGVLVLSGGGWVSGVGVI